MSKEHVRLIDANALKKRAIKVMFRDCPESGEFYAVGTCDIDIMPTIDPESLRPTAHWENEEDFNGDPVFDPVNSKCISFDSMPKISDFGDENDLIRRGDALKAIRKACISAHLPFDSATPEGKRVMDALYAVWKVKKEGKTHDSI